MKYTHTPHTVSVAHTHTHTQATKNMVIHDPLDSSEKDNTMVTLE